MKKNMEKDKKKRLSSLKLESSRKLLKYISQNLHLPMVLRSKANLSLSSLAKSNSFKQVKKRCILTGRGKFILGQFNLSRLMFRKLAGSNQIPGLRKSSW